MKKIILNFIFLSVALMVGSNIVFGQTAEKRSITLDGARTVISAAKDYARKNNAPGGVIAVRQASFRCAATLTTGTRII